MLIAESADNIPTHLRNMRYFLRPEDFESDEASLFLAQLERYLAAEFARISPRLDEEPGRLLSLGEYRAAVIAAYSLLEHELRLALAMFELPTGPGRRIISIRDLLRHGVALGILPSELVDLLQVNRQIRNKIVHSYDADVNEMTAQHIVATVFEAIDELRKVRASRIVPPADEQRSK